MADMTKGHETVNRNMRVLMTLHGHRQVDLAALLGVAQATLGGKLTGRRPWGLDELEKLADVYGLPVDRLLRPVVLEGVGAGVGGSATRGRAATIEYPGPEDDPASPFAAAA